MKCDLCEKKSKWIYGDLNLCDTCLSIVGIDFEEEQDPVFTDESKRDEEGFLYDMEE